jgi:hypothetical protein
VDTFSGHTVYSELATLSYVSLGNRAYVSPQGQIAPPGWGLTNTADFVFPAPAVGDVTFWTDVEVTGFEGVQSWSFNMNTGYQSPHCYPAGLQGCTPGTYVIAVHDGDVGTPLDGETPRPLHEPGTAALLALAGLAWAHTCRRAPQRPPMA